MAGADSGGAFAARTAKQQRPSDGRRSDSGSDLSTPSAPQLADNLVEHVLFLQRTIGNQSTLNLLTQRDYGAGGPRGLSAPASDQRGTSAASFDAADSGVEVERRSGQHGHGADGTVTAPRSSPGHPLDAATRSMFEARFGDNFSQVKIHTGVAAAQSASALSARAYTAGENIVFSEGAYAPERPSGQHLLAHELAHVVQQRRGTGAAPLAGDTAVDRAADRAADSAMRGEAVTVTGPSRIGVARQPLSSPAPAGPFTPPTPAPPVNPFADPTASSGTAEAAKALDAYRKLAPDDRHLVVSVTDKKTLAQVLAALSPTDQTKTFVDQLREIGRFVEEMATRQTLKASDAKIAARQAKFLADQPKPEEVTANANAIQEKAPVSWWEDTLSGSERAAWTTRGNAAIAKVVTFATAKHPELGITAANFNLDFKAIEDRGANVLAMGSPAIVGKRFVETAELNPAYVMDIVVHEVFGHPEYGPYGSEYHLKLYDMARKHDSGYTQPAEGTKERNAERDAWAYHETEIYAALRSVPYHTVPTAADAPKVATPSAQWLVTDHINRLTQAWAPTIAVGLLRGLRQRLAVDPRITDAALQIFDAALLQNSSAATVAEVTKGSPR